LFCAVYIGKIVNPVDGERTLRLRSLVGPKLARIRQQEAAAV